MSEFSNPVPKFFVAGSNVPLSAGTIDFFEPGTTTRKNVFIDVNLTNAAANPVVLSGGGVMPFRFLDGSYKIVIKDKDGVVQETRDPISSSGLIPFSTWDSSVTYTLNNTVQGSDGCFYISITTNNLNKDPTTPNPTFWTKIKLTEVYNLNQIYKTDDIVQGSDGETYKSLSAINLNNDPTLDTDRSNWVNLGQPSVSKAASKIFAFNNFT